MQMAATVFVGIVAFLHLYFMVLESFLWNTPYGHKTFKMSKEKADHTESLAKNQGLYNGFLAAGLIWSLMPHDGAMAFQLKVFFLGCVIVAAIVGAITASRSILFIQGLPAAIALALVFVAG
jgi:putative membrane protein